MKKLNLMRLEEQQLDKKQLENVQGGVNWCDCWASETGYSNSVSAWLSTPEPGNPGNSAQAGAQQPGINWCDCMDAPNNSISVWQSTPSPC